MERPVLARCARGGCELREGDTAYEQVERRIVTKGKTVTISNVPIIVCERHA